MKVTLKTQSVSIRAPRSAVFKLISSFGDIVDGGKTPEAPDKDEEGNRVIERDGNRLLMEFRSRDGRKMYRTLEEVVLYPEERITFRHLEGPLHYSQEEFVFVEVDSGTTMTHNGVIECRMHLLPGAGWMVARFYVKRRYENLVLRHMNSLKDQAEGNPTE
ncbi:MAG: SRPBCC family protein [Chloroflexi bacterium]|nr:SRPBCC family protein [Chloroflexota bacterium]